MGPELNWTVFSRSDAAKRSGMKIWDVASGVVMAREGGELEGEYEMEW